MIDILIVSLSTAAAVLAVLAVSPFLLKRYGRKWRYWVWLLFAVRLIIPLRPELPSAPLEVPRYVPQISVSVSDEVAEPRPPERTERTADTPEPNGATESGADAGNVAFIIWAVGAAVFLGAHTASYALFMYRIKPRLVSEGENVYRCELIDSPALVGFTRPMILLPDTEYTDEEREMIIAHERAHFRRKDMWYKLILLIANSMHWFNPIVYLMARRANDDIEYTCDDAVLRGRDMEYRKKYSRVILKTMVRRRK